MSGRPSFPVLPASKDSRLKWSLAENRRELPELLPVEEPSQTLFNLTEEWALSWSKKQSTLGRIRIRAPWHCRASICEWDTTTALALSPNIRYFRVSSTSGAPIVDTERFKPTLVLGFRSPGDIYDIAPVMSGLLDQQIWNVKSRVSRLYGSRLSANPIESWLANLRASAETFQKQLSNAFGEFQLGAVPLDLDWPSRIHLEDLGEKELAIRSIIATALEKLEFNAGDTVAEFDLSEATSVVCFGWLWRAEGHQYWSRCSQIFNTLDMKQIPPSILRHGRTSSTAALTFVGGAANPSCPSTVRVHWNSIDRSSQGLRLMTLVCPPMNTEKAPLPANPFGMRADQTILIEAVNPSHAIGISTPRPDGGSTGISWPYHESSTAELPDHDDFWLHMRQSADAGVRTGVFVSIGGQGFAIPTMGRLAVASQQARVLLECLDDLRQHLLTEDVSYSIYHRNLKGGSDPVDDGLETRFIVSLAKLTENLLGTTWSGHVLEASLISQYQALKLLMQNNDRYKATKFKLGAKLAALSEAVRDLCNSFGSELWNEVLEADSETAYSTFLEIVSVLKQVDYGRMILQNSFSGFFRDDNGTTDLFKASEWADLVRKSPAARSAFASALLAIGASAIEQEFFVFLQSEVEAHALRSLTTRLLGGLTTTLKQASVVPEVRWLEERGDEFVDISHSTPFSDWLNGGHASTTGEDGIAPLELGEGVNLLIGLLETLHLSASLVIDPDNESLRSKLALSSLRLTTSVLNAAAGLMPKSQAMLSVSATNMLKGVAKIGGFGLDCYSLLTSLSQTKDAIYSGENVTWQIAGESVMAAQTGVTAWEIAEIFGLIATGPGAGLAMSLGWLSVLVSIGEAATRTPPSVEMLKNTYFGEDHEASDVSGEEGTWRHMYGRIRTQISHLNFYTGHHYDAKMSDDDGRTLITLSPVPKGALIFIQTWDGHVEHWNRKLYWFEVGNDRSHGYFEPVDGDASTGGPQHTLIIASSSSQFHSLTVGTGTHHLVRGHADFDKSSSADATGKNPNIAAFWKPDKSLAGIYLMDSDLDRAVASVEISPGSRHEGDTSIWRYVRRVHSSNIEEVLDLSKDRVDISTLLAEMDSFSSVLIKKGE